MKETAGTWLGLPRPGKRLIQAGILLGLGLGGFFDGIVFHQILQWHHMVSDHADPSIAGDLEFNVMMDGFFHAATYLFTIGGIVLLWRAWSRPAVAVSGRTLAGATILGWGLFNLLEGGLNHHLLGIHHVRAGGPGGTLLWDLSFLLWGVLFVAVGYLTVRRDDSLSMDQSDESVSDQQPQGRDRQHR